MDGLALMEDGLAVAADEINSSHWDAELFAGLERSFGVGVTKAEVELAEVAGGDGALFGDAEDFFLESGRIGNCCVVEEFGFYVWRSAGNSC